MSREAGGLVYSKADTISRPIGQGGIAIWDPTSSTCGLNQTQDNAAPVGSTAISVTAGSGPLCVRVYDGGNLTAGTTASYTLQVQHY